MARRTTARRGRGEFDEPFLLRGLLCDGYGIKPAVLAVIGFLIVAVLVVFAIWADGKDEEACKAKGGERVSHTFNGYDSSGKFVTMTETECVIPR